ncbi:MAG: DNA polymerase III subunit beta [Clostridia bacterium]|nr:DNA polymerase III subunit beta [Clostridia bacterium]
MIFSCEKARINEAVAVVSRAAAAKSSLAALEGILLEAAGDKVKLTAYDLDIAVIFSIPAQIEAEGSIVLPAKLFGDIVRKLPDGMVRIQTDEKFMTKINGGSVKFTIAGLSPVEYPELPTVIDGDELILECESFKNLLKQTVFAAAETDERPVLQGILFDIEAEQNKIHGVAVDGIRLAVRNEPIISFKGMNEKFVIPKKTVLELLKNIPEETEELVVNISISHKHLIFRMDEKVIISRRLEGEFLNYKIAIPSNHNFSVTVDKRQMASSIERAALLVNPTVRIPIHCTFDYSIIKLSTTTNMGKFYDEFEIEPFHNTLEIGFNHRMMLDALNACEDSEVKIELGSALEPIVLKPVEGDDFIFLVMPMRLTND